MKNYSIPIFEQVQESKKRNDGHWKKCLGFIIHMNTAECFYLIQQNIFDS